MHTTVTEQTFDLVAYAKKHRYRMRNLHDGGPVPPAIWKPPKGGYPSWRGAAERMDAIVGRRGYVAMDGDKLSVCLFYRSAKGVKRAVERLEAIGGQIDQVGDMEMGATAPAEHIDELMRLIIVSKLHPGDASRLKPHTERARDAESPESCQVVQIVHSVAYNRF